MVRTPASCALRLPLLLGLLLLTGCAGSAPEAAAPTPAPSAPAASTPAAAPSPTPTAEPVQVVDLRVAQGRPSGDTGRVPVELGSRVRLVVESDVADELHLHGYDLRVDVAPGQPAQLELVADRPGVFEAELEGTHLVLTRLQVS